MAVKDSSRRKSVAATGHARQSLVPRHRRRAHSGVGVPDLSPLARSRLSAPLKGILKMKARLSDDTTTTISASSSKSSARPSVASADAENASQTMEFTQDYQAPVHDNFTRKSLGRRVSFSQNAQVRLFDKVDNTNSTGSPQSSPAAPSSDPPEQSTVPPNDENAYSRANIAQRRSSIRFSLGSDMDLTDGPDNDQSFSDMSDDFGDIDTAHLPTADDPVPESDPEADPERDPDDSDDISLDSSHDIGDEESRKMEYAVPVGQALNPATQDPVWLELQKATHAGKPDEEDEDEDMELDDSLPVNFANRAKKRISLGLGALDDLKGRPSLGFGDDSFSSVEDSLDGSIDGGDDGEKTMNLSKMYARASLGGRLSETMDESGTYGQILPPPSPQPPASTTTVSASLPPEPPATTTSTIPSGSSLYPTNLLRKEQPISSVFQPPPRSNSQATPKPTNTPRQPAPSLTTPSTSRIPQPSSVFSRPEPRPSSVPPTPTFRPRSPSKGLPSTTPLRPPPPAKTYTAAFAPPTSSPKKSTITPLKRVLPADENAVNGRTPVKRPNVLQTQTTTPAAPPPKPAAPPPVVHPLAPSKKAPFEPNGPPATDAPAPAARRTSGYFARRRSSVAGGSIAPPLQPQSSTSAGKKPQAGRGRPSMGASASNDAVNPSNVDPTVDQQQMDQDTPTASPQQDEEMAVPPRETPAEEPLVEDEQVPMEEDAPEPPTENEVEDTPTISINQFMQMTGIQFMDNLRAPRKSVRSTKMSSIRPLENISLSEQAMAVLLELPQLMLYSRVGHELQEWITQNSEVYSKMEEEALEATPELFIEYARAEEDEQADLRQSLDIFRSNVRLQSRGAWYDWKHQWLTGIHATAQEARQEYEADVRLAESLRKQAEADTAALEADYEALSRQLEKEEAEVAELEGCNMEYLEELKTSLADQNGVIASLEAEVSQTEGNAAHLKEHLTQIQTEMKGNLDALTKAMGLLHVSKDKLERSRRETQPQSLQQIHMCVVTSYKPALFEYEYASQYRVRIPCSDFGKPIHDKIEITHLERIQKDEFAPLNQTFLDCANALVREDTRCDLPGVATVLQNYVAACEQLRRQFIHLVIRFPLHIVPIPSGGFVAKAIILYPVLKSRVAVEFVFDPQTFSHWPCSVRSLQFDVKVAFGKADRTAIVKAVQDVLIAKTPTDNYACLTEACMEAAALWD